MLKKIFKSTFIKYFAAFTVIILSCFLALSGIITSMIRAYAKEEKEKELTQTASIVSGMISAAGVENLSAFITAQMSYSLAPLVSRNRDIAVMLTDADGTVLLSTLDAPEKEGLITPRTYLSGNLGEIDFSFFQTEEVENKEYKTWQGTPEGISDGSYLFYASPIATDDATLGYAVALTETTTEDNLIVTTRRAVITSSLWVMLAAVIAFYFITERIVQPLRSMTQTVKTFGKGNFSERVPVVGNDEVTDLAVAFNNMADSLENYDKMRNSFMASVSHDLRTPMTTIAGFIDGINSGAIPPEKQEYYLGVVSAEVHRLSRLVGELLDVSRLQSGERKFVFADFDIAEVARLILISFEQKIEEKKLDVEFFAEEDSMFVTADKDAIYQVLYNLCHNAVKFAEEGGKFIISIRRAENKKIAVSVFDEGLTVGRDEAPFIFQQFYKIDQSRGLDKTGVGLGLYISKTIIDAHGETLSVNPDREDGCEFTFTLKEGSAPRRSALPPSGDTE